MRETLQHIFSLKAYTDPITRRRASNLYWVISVLAAATFVNIISVAFTNGLTDPGFVINTGLLAVWAVAIWLNRVGRQDIAVWIFVSTVLAGSLLLAAFDDEATRELTLFLSYGIWITLVISGLLMSSTSIVALTALTTLALALAFSLADVTVRDYFTAEGESQTVAQIFYIVLTIIVSGISWLISRTFGYVSDASKLQEANRRLQLTQTSTAVSQRILTHLDLETLLEETVELIRDQFVDIYHAQVFLVNPENNRAELRASTGEVGKRLLNLRHSLEVGSRSVIGTVTQTGVPVLVSDTSTDPVHRVNELLPNTLTELAIPLKTREGIIGALDVQSTRRNAFSQEDIEVLQTFANQIAIAVEHARLFSASQEEARRAQTLALTSQIATRMLGNLESGIEELFEAIAPLGGYTHFWFGVVDSNQKQLKAVTTQKAEAQAKGIYDSIDLEKDQNSLVEAFKQKQTIIVNDFSLSTGFQAATATVHHIFGKHVVVPVFSPDGRTVRGMLLVGRPLSSADLDQRDTELVASVASQISIALENERLFTQLQSEQQTLQSVLDTMPIGVMVTDTQHKIILANQQAQHLLGEGIYPGSHTSDSYPIYRTGTGELYPLEELPLNRALETGQTFSAEDLAVQRPDGSLIDTLSKSAPVFNASGKVEYVVSIYQDISELRELERALQDSLSETTKLYEVSRAISHSTTLQAINQTVINQMLTLKPDHIYLTLKNPNQADEETELTLAAAYPESIETIDAIGLPQSLLLPSSARGATNVTFSTRNLHLLPHIEEKDVRLLQDKGIQALAVLPLETRGQVFGAVIATFTQDRSFAPEERRFLLTLADQTAVAIDAALSFERTQQTLRSISKLYQASRAIAEVQDMDEAMQVIREQIMLMSPDWIDITFSRDQENTSLETVMIWSSNGTDTEKPLLLPGKDLPSDLLSSVEHYIENVIEAAPQDKLAASLVANQSPYQAVAVVPFRAVGQPNGRLTVAFRQRHKFSQDDRQFLRLIADSTAYIIENDILFKQTQDSLEETGILYQAIRAFANAQDKEGILQAIIDYAADPAVDKAMLCLLITESWDAPNALMEVAVSWVRSDSVDLAGMRFTAEQFPSWKQISTTEVLWVNDVMQAESLDETARMGYRALDIASFVIVPLLIANRPLGAILLGSSEPRVHTEREIRIYQSLADQAAITMENIRLYEEAERRARQLATSARVSQAASSILQISDLLPEMVDLIKEAFGYDHVQVFLLSEDGKNALLKASTGEAGRQLLAIGHKLEVGSRSVIGTVTETGKPSIALDTADARVIHKPNPYLPNTRSEMAIPLIAKGKVLGALDVQSNHPGAFTENDVRVLTILAEQLAVAIENASLFELSQRRSEEMAFLFTVAAESTAARELQEILQRVSELLLHQLDATLVAPYLFDEVNQVLRLGAFATTPDYAHLDPQQTIALEAGSPIARVTLNKMPVLMKDQSHGTQYTAPLTLLKSGIYMPLITRDKFIGVLAVESNQPNKFDENTLNLLQALTGSLSAVIQNSRLLQDIQAANERLREVDKLKTNFLAAMSHELRTPLNSIIGFSRVILKGIDGPVTDMQRQDLQTIHDSGKHLLGLVNDILDQAKIEAGKMELAREYFDLTEVIKGVMSSAVGLTKEKPIRLYTEIEPDLPKAFGDEFRTRQVLFNLISNAAKFTEAGSITTSANLIEDNGRKVIRVSVTDTGIGIRPEDFDKLFESFQQVDNSTTRAAEGTGLGLPLAKSLTELQGGRIWVESEHGVGSTFNVTIPIEPIAEVEEAEAPAEAPSSNGKSADKLVSPTPKTIIVVEDNIDMINFYRRHLSKAGYDVVGAINEEEVSQKIMHFRPSAIIINVNLAEDHGWMILDTVNKMPLPQPVPVIASSLYADASRSLEMGAAFHLTRPFSPEDLLQAIRQVEEKVSSQ